MEEAAEGGSQFLLSGLLSAFLMRGSFIDFLFCFVFAFGCCQGLSLSWAGAQQPWGSCLSTHASRAAALKTEVGTLSCGWAAGPSAPTLLSHHAHLVLNLVHLTFPRPLPRLLLQHILGPLSSPPLLPPADPVPHKAIPSPILNSTWCWQWTPLPRACSN